MPTSGLSLHCTTCGSHFKLAKRPPENKVRWRCPKCGSSGDLPAAAPENTDEVALAAYPPDSTSTETPAPDRIDPTNNEPPVVPMLESEDLKETAQLSGLRPAQLPDEMGRLGGYRILKILGQGGMGMVYQAEDPKLKRQIALKIMLPEVALNPKNRLRFMSEAQAQAALSHEHITPIFQVGEDNGVPYMAMPMLKGESLTDRLHRESRLPLGEIIRIGREIAEGLAAAHEVNLIHRDIKPNNIWLEGSRQRVKIFDFGLARAVEVDDSERITMTGAIVGTPAYMSPEQARAEPLTPSTDLFSLGVILYRMSAGDVPFRASSTIGTLTALVSDQPVPPRVHSPQLPEALNDLILSLLAKTPSGRPGSARELVDILTGYERDGFGPKGSVSPGSGIIPLPTNTSIFNPRYTPQNANTGPGSSRILKSGGKVFVQTAKSPGTTMFPPLENSWLAWIRTLPPEDKITVVAEELVRRNPGFDGQIRELEDSNSKVRILCFATESLADLTPLSALTDLRGCFAVSNSCKGILRNLEPLRRLPLSHLYLGGNPIADLEPLRGLLLKILSIASTEIKTLEPLKGMPLEVLNLSNTKVVELSPLQGMKLRTLSLQGCPVSDLAGVRGMPLRQLFIDGTRIHDLRPVQGLPLEEFRSDPSILSAPPNVAILRGLKQLKKINDVAAADFWKRH